MGTRRTTKLVGCITGMDIFTARAGGRSARAVVTALAMAAVVSGCDTFPFGTCTVRVVELTMPADWGFRSDTTHAEWFTRLAETNLTPAEFAPIGDAFEAADEPTGSLSWILPAFDTVPGWVGVRMEVPVQPGDRIPIRGAAPVGGFDLRADRTSGAWVDVRLGDFRATEAEGEMEVLAVSPLRLRVRLTAGDGSRTLRVQGTMAFRVFEKETECD